MSLVESQPVSTQTVLVHINDAATTKNPGRQDVIFT